MENSLREEAEPFFSEPIEVEAEPFFSGKAAPIEVIETSKVHWIQFAFIVYFCVCGGQYGIESVIGSAGPLLGMGMILFLPLVWNVPVAYMTIKLTSLSEGGNEGAYAWIKSGTHESIAFASAILYYLNYAIDTALYPALFVSYFKELDPELFGGSVAFWLISAGLVLVVTSLNLAGVKLQGRLSMILTILLLSPIPILFVWAGVAGWITPSVWLSPPPGPVGNWTWADATTVDGLTDINAGLGVVIWSNSGYDSVGSMLAQLRDSSSRLPGAMTFALILSSGTYILSLLPLLGAPPHGNFAPWVPGYFATAASVLGGNPLKIYVIICALLACFGTIQALMLPISMQLYELSGRAWLDIPFLRLLSKRKVPWVSVLFNAAITIGLSRLGFGLLVQVNNLLYAINLLLIILSFVRVTRKAENRSWAILLIAVFPCVICLWLIVSIFWLVSWLAGVVCFSAYGIGLVLWWACGKRHLRRDQKETEHLRTSSLLIQ